MDEQELKARTKAFALRVLKVVEALPKTIPGKTVADQLIRSGTSVAANYRAACICRSKAEFAAKLGTVLEETDESCYWMEFIADGGLLPAENVADLHAEGEELRAIFLSSVRTAKSLPNPNPKSPLPLRSAANPKSKISNLRSPLPRVRQAHAPAHGQGWPPRQSALLGLHRVSGLQGRAGGCLICDL